MPTCSIEGCDKPTKARGWCNAHWKRWIRHGDPLAGAAANGEPMRFLLDTAMPFTGDGCLEWPFAKNQYGYGIVTYEGKASVVTRLICALTNGNAESNLDAAHSCGNGHLGCCNPRHISWKTRAANKADTVLHGTHDRGSRNGNSKLTEEDVAAIRKLRGDGLTQSAIGAMYGVSRAAIYKIESGKGWRWL